jgi:hypothetical protein
MCFSPKLLVGMEGALDYKLFRFLLIYNTDK